MENEMKAQAMERVGELASTQVPLGCTCGQPGAVGVMHRASGQCFVIGGAAAVMAGDLSGDTIPFPNELTPAIREVLKEVAPKWNAESVYACLIAAALPDVKGGA